MIGIRKSHKNRADCASDKEADADWKHSKKNQSNEPKGKAVA